MPEERLQKILSQAGIASRRKSEELILEGRVSVNGKTVAELGSKADIEHDHIKVDGRALHVPKHHVYFALHKPKNIVTTASDPEGRETVLHLMRGVRERVYPVGRLDYQSEGLLLMTNDGEFAHRITAPSSHVTKTYVVKVNGPLTLDQERVFREGIPMHGRKTAPAELKAIKAGSNPWYEVKITEGRQNQIRVMFKHFGKLVEKLRRVKIGFLDLDVAPGRYRSLTLKEVERFRKLLKLDDPDTYKHNRGEAAEEEDSEAISADEAFADEAFADGDVAAGASESKSASKHVSKPGSKPVSPGGRRARSRRAKELASQQASRPVAEPSRPPRTSAREPQRRGSDTAKTKPSFKPRQGAKPKGRPPAKRDDRKR